MENPKPILRVHRPKVSHPRPPKHLMNPISPKQLLGFEKMVRRIPNGFTFEEALECRPLLSHFRDCRETREEIEALYHKARRAPLKRLKKKEDPGKFSVSCFISGVEFKESLVDSGSSVNVMSKAIAEKLGIGIQAAAIPLTFANSVTSPSYGTIPDLLVKVGDCLVPTDFQVVEMSDCSSTPLIFGRPFMATVGTVIDMSSDTISFSDIDKEVFYKAISRTRAPKQISCIDILEEPDGVDRHQPPVSIDTRHRTSQKVKRRDKPKSDIMFTSSPITLTPQRRVGDAIEYKVKCKGMSKPFSKVKALITPELKAQGQAAVDNALSKVLKLNMHDHRVRAPRLNPPPPLPDPSSDSFHP